MIAAGTMRHGHEGLIPQGIVSPSGTPSDPNRVILASISTQVDHAAKIKPSDLGQKISAVRDRPVPESLGDGGSSSMIYVVKAQEIGTRQAHPTAQNVRERPSWLGCWGSTASTRSSP